MKVFLKYNREGPSALICLHYWIELFSNYEIIINCDLFDVDKDKIPDNLKNLALNKNVKFINSDYSTGNIYTPNFKAKKRAMASANLTAWNHLKSEDQYFWIIDADDTMFLSANFNLIREKIKLAEDYALKHNLDGFSLDFYREYNDSWTFGVCLLKTNIPWKDIKNVTTEELIQNGLANNCDSCFDMLGRKGIVNLKNFVFDRCSFQHLINKNYTAIPNGLYYWRDGKLWNTPLKPDVIVL